MQLALLGLLRPRGARVKWFQKAISDVIRGSQTLVKAEAR